jgi:hypothetical protein
MADHVMKMTDDAAFQAIKTGLVGYIQSPES